MLHLCSPDASFSCWAHKPIPPCRLSTWILGWDSGPHTHTARLLSTITAPDPRFHCQCTPTRLCNTGSLLDMFGLQKCCVRKSLRKLFHLVKSCLLCSSPAVPNCDPQKLCDRALRHAGMGRTASGTDPIPRAPAVPWS